MVNGEIYNHHELRDTHLRDPATDSDSEAALSAVLSEDDGALAQLRGMYAFAVAGEDGDLVVVDVRDGTDAVPLELVSPTGAGWQPADTGQHGWDQRCVASSGHDRRLPVAQR